MDYNYHTHTYLCSHATGEIEDYIKTAIENGIKYMGFSEHFPLRFENGVQSGYRLMVEDVDFYFSTLYGLREKYKDKIDIKIGFEMEYYPALFDEMVNNAKKYGGEYLILGQHFPSPEYLKSSKYVIIPEESANALEDYVSGVVEGIKSGVFTYVAHPDILNFVGDKDLYRESFVKICEASKKYNVPLEINFLGIRDNRNYPDMRFVELLGETKAPVTFGFDSHTVKDAFDKESLKTAKEWVEKYKLNYIGKPNIKEI